MRKTCERGTRTTHIDIEINHHRLYITLNFEKKETKMKKKQSTGLGFQEEIVRVRLGFWDRKVRNTNLFAGEGRNKLQTLS